MKKQQCMTILSTMHDMVEINLDTYKTKPLMVYYSTKGCVGSVDKMCSTYLIEKLDIGP